MTTDKSMPNNTALAANELCRSCGICCDGSLFSYVPVSKIEGSRLAKLGLVIKKGKEDKEDKYSFKLDCSQLKDCSCSIYEHRPKACQDFYCALTRSVVTEAISLDEAKQIVTNIKTNRLWLIDHVPDAAAKVKIPASPKAIFAAWKKTSSDKPDVVHGISLRVILTDFHTHLNARKPEDGFTDEEKLFSLKAFEHLKLHDKHLQKTSLLMKYAGLVQMLYSDDL